jgi:ribonuclease R
MRDQLLVTIDGETARDFDDAVAIERDGDGYLLYVHIADVSHYVDEGGTVDMEARRRATSVYFPDRVIPMLPKALSEELCSLRPGEDRPVMTVEMRIDARGLVTGAEFYPSLIRSSERMTYTAVAGIIEHHDEAVMERYAPLVDTFETMEELAMLLRAQRLDRGSLDFDLPEPEVMLDATGRPEAILKAERNRAHMLIEDFMIAANEAVAGYLEGAGAACVYRIHEEPDPGKVDTLLGMARVMLRLPPSRRPKGLHGLVKAVKGSDVEDVIMFQALRSMKQARYSTENVGHYGLASECYCHFTSPIRRYPDLIVHRLLKATLAGSGGLHERNLEELAYHCSTMERAAMEAERSVLAALRVWFMRERLGQEMPGRVVGVGTWGLRVRLDEFFVDGSVDMVSLSDDYYVYDEDTVTLRGRHGGRIFRLGQKLKVRVDRANPEDRMVWFGLVGMAPGRIRAGRVKLNTGGGSGGQRPKTRRRRR